jgi:hypothetical protein
VGGLLLFVFAFLIEGAKGGCIVLFGYIVDFFLFTTNNIEYKLYTINGQLTTVEKKTYLRNLISTMKFNVLSPRRKDNYRKKSIFRLFPYFI